ncbi:MULTISPECIES: lantibiotic dehydratase [Paenibacillus]|uniref:Lantibiotic dehydratase n=1 Tax=Paenibacillus albilobatus TaxID=2716884 RepID=A0A919XIP5_9BACL|nr:MULTISPECIES: lantibiotic dehydratase [Paenibacillus]GIO33632.1 lantibiotic dehydratase [Paenibacillus albilobatus]
MKMHTSINPLKSKRWYKPCDFFIVRIPLLPLNAYLQVLSQPSFQAKPAQETEERLKEVAMNSIVQEAIAVASPSLRSFLNCLHTTACESDRKALQKYEKTLVSFLRYFIRMSTRTTPYGLFSRVAQGYFGDRSDLDAGSVADNRKRARPDMEWIFHLIKRLESDPVIVDGLKVSRNKTSMLKGNRVKLPVRPQYGILKLETSPEGINSIGFSEVVEFALKAAEEPIEVKTLKQVILKAFPEATEDIVHHFLSQLLEQEFMISELRPPFMDVSPLEHIRGVLAGTDGAEKWMTVLSDISNLFYLYERCLIGEGEPLFHQLTEKMNEVVTTDHLVQVDVTLDKHVMLSRSVADDAALGAELMCKLFVPEGAGLEEYLNRFLEKYGVYQEIPIQELFDPDWGLGVPKAYQPEFSPEGQQNLYGRNAALFQLVSEAVRQGSVEIQLTEEYVRQLTVVTDPNDAPESMEIYYTLLADSARHVDQGDYMLVLGASAGSSGAGKTMGRFMDMFDSTLIEKFKQIYAHHQRFHPDAVLAELVFMPSSGRVSNIMLGKNGLAYEIVSGTTSSKDQQHTLHIDDLLVGATYDRFYIKSKRLGKEVIPLQTHMFNHRISPYIFRFLSDISRKLMGTWSYFNWGPLEQSPFLPRLRYQNIIISSAQWRLSKLTLGSTDSREEWDNTFNLWKDRWKVPRYVYLTMGDNRLLLDLNNPLCIDELRREIAKLRDGQELLLTECIDHPGSTPLTSDNGKYIGEFVFPLLKSKIDPKPSPDLARKGNLKHGAAGSPFVSRGILPGEEWLYIKLYGIYERENDLIGLHLADLWDRPEIRQWAEKFYFIRYKDDENHIRLRFYGNPQELWSTGIRYLNQWCNKLRHDGLLTRMTIDTYVPEFERYGGITLMEMAESVFAADSKFVSLYLGEVRRKQIHLAEEAAAVMNILDILSSFGLNLEEQMNWLERKVDGKEHMKAYRELKNDIIQAMEAKEAGLLFRADAPNPLLHALYERQTLIQSYSKMIHDANKQTGLTNDPNDILASLVHMHINRLLGINRELEIKCMALAKFSAAHFYHAKGALNVIS